MLGVFLVLYTSKQAQVILKNLYSSFHNCLLKKVLKYVTSWIYQINFEIGILKIEMPVSPHIAFIENNLYLTLLSASQKS